MSEIIKTKKFDLCPLGSKGTNTFQDILTGTITKTKAGDLTCHSICPFFIKTITEKDCKGYDQDYYLCKKNKSK